jgi:hypothetical protein
MIILDTTSQSLKVNLGNTSVTTNQLDWTISYVTIASATYTPGSAVGTTNNNTAVTMVANTAATIQVKFISVFNNDTTNKVVEIEKVNGVNTRTICRMILAPDETLQYSDGEGFSVMDATGLSVTPGATVGLSAGTQSVSGVNTVVFSNSNGISFGLNTNSVLTASVSGISLSYWDTPHGNLVFNAMGSAASTPNIQLQRLYMPFYMTATRIDILAQVSMSTQTNITAAISQSIGIYARTGSYLSLLSELSSSQSLSAGGASNNTNSYAGASGTRWRSNAPSSWAITPGEYYVAFGLRVSTSVNALTYAIAGFSTVGVNGMPYGANTDANVNSPDINNWGVAGAVSVGSSDLPSMLHYDQIVWAGTGASSVVNRQPYFRFFGTY